MAASPPSVQNQHIEPSSNNAVANLVHIPAWEHLPWLWAAFSTRGTGLSQAYGVGEQNLGWTAEDDRQHVAGNRRRFLQEVTGQADLPLMTVKQIHSGIFHDRTVKEVPFSPASPSDAGGNSTPSSDSAGLEGDGLISGTAGHLLGILTADCVPVLVADKRTRTVAAFHAGWRGTLARIVESGIRHLRERHGAQPEDLVAAIGPAIRPCCFEVGPEVQAAFASAFPYADSLFSSPARGPKLRLDLQEANRQQLLASGLQPEQISTVAECTSCYRTAGGQRKYFSYRAEGGRTGRMMSVIGTNPNA